MFRELARRLGGSSHRPIDEDAGVWVSRRTDGLLLGVLIAGPVVGVLVLTGHGAWAGPAAALVVLLAVLGSPPRRIVLHDDSLVLRGGRDEVRIPLDEITSIRLDRVLNVGEQLVIASDAQRIRVTDLTSARDFLLTLGQALRERADRRVVASAREAGLLGLCLRWGTHPAGTHPPGARADPPVPPEPGADGSSETGGSAG